MMSNISSDMNKPCWKLAKACPQSQILFCSRENILPTIDSSCLTELEKVQMRDMLYEYREVFSLRDEIWTCLNIEIDIDVTDRTPFFIRPYHVKEEDKRILDKEMKRPCYLGILKEGFSVYSIPVMLISRKVTQDKRVVTDFRHLNTRIAKNNLAYPLVKDTFTTLGNSKCKVLSVLDLKDAFPLTEIVRKLKEILWCFAILWKCLIFVSKDAYGT